MNRAPHAMRSQLGLFLEPQVSHQPPEETREALIEALAELLLEAYGDEADDAHQRAGGDDESEDHR
jgi:hypothetical protein